MPEHHPTPPRRWTLPPDVSDPARLLADASAFLCERSPRGWRQLGELWHCPAHAATPPH